MYNRYTILDGTFTHITAELFKVNSPLKSKLEGYVVVAIGLIALDHASCTCYNYIVLCCHCLPH